MLTTQQMVNLARAEERTLAALDRTTLILEQLQQDRIEGIIDQALDAYAPNMTPAQIAETRLALYASTDIATAVITTYWSQALDAIVDLQREYFAVVGEVPTLSTAIVDVLKGGLDGTKGHGLLGKVYNLDTEAVTRANDILTRGVLTDGDINQTRDELQRELNITKNKADALYHDGTQLYTRSVQAEMTKGRYDYFLYTGPRDDKMRPFCRKHEDKIYSRDEIEELDNGQIENVFLTGGGYRCRHIWRPVKEDWFSPEEWASMRG